MQYSIDLIHHTTRMCVRFFVEYAHRYILLFSKSIQ